MQHVTERAVGKAVEGPDGTTIGEVTGVQGDRAIVEPASPLDDPVGSRLESNGPNETMAVTADDIAVERDDAIELEAV